MSAEDTFDDEMMALNGIFTSGASRVRELHKTPEEKAWAEGEIAKGRKLLDSFGYEPSPEMVARYCELIYGDEWRDGGPHIIGDRAAIGRADLIFIHTGKKVEPDELD